MTMPIGYPEQFGTLLQREAPELGYAPNKLSVQKPADASVPTETKVLEGPTFADHLAGFVSGIDQTQKSAEYKAEEFAVGHHNDIHGTMIAVEQAEISLHLLANVRNRVVDLYREVMRMGS
ncbi:MAG TPA: flagellar hook-basal body complex protein FliE [Polyangiales bacterium]|nr:flagellar hook-basal body complex protein FliE [Polyangiales bacterium]